jgi:hypothetical protein
VLVSCGISSAEVSISSGLMAGKRGIDGSSAAYDMKSLGWHIEAVSKINSDSKIALLTASTYSYYRSLLRGHN